MNFLLHTLPGLADNLRRQRDQTRLLEMSDDLLRDIGLTRADVVKKAKWSPFRRRGK